MKPGSGKLSYGCFVRTLFLGVPIVWLVVVTIMVFSLSMENAMTRWQRSSAVANVIHKGHGHGESNHVAPIDMTDNRKGQEEVRDKEQMDQVNWKGHALDDNDGGLKEPDKGQIDPNSIAAQLPKDKLSDRNALPLPQDGLKFARNDFDKVGNLNGDGGVVEMNAGEKESIDKVMTKQNVAADGNENMAIQQQQVVDVSDLVQFPELKRLAPILKPAEDSNAPGENGRAVHITREQLTPEETVQFDHGWKVNSFNQFASDKISVHRTLQNTFNEKCGEVTYSNLPDTSIIICFHNEAMSVLLRTVHSVLKRSPPHLIKEIILVDDFSDQDHLKGALEAYVARLDKVRLVRTGERVGLIRARLLGYTHATGTVLTFLDSHCECSEGWLEPLLGPIAEDVHTITSPVIDSISDQTISYNPVGRSLDAVMIGTFDWNLLFHWKSMPQREKQRRKKPSDPVRTPVIAGGLFSVSREFFTYLGTYDAGMRIWGGENLEISFRTWMCGGRLLIMPCSHVGHIFRKTSPYNKLAGQNVLQRNSMRVAMVWLDEYKQYYLERFISDIVRYGDVSERVALRKQLNCNSFKWYLENVYPEMYVPTDTTAAGEIVNMGAQICLEWNKKAPFGPIRTFGCHGQGGNQFWMLTKDDRIVMDDYCVGAADGLARVDPCNEDNKSQRWLYRKDMSLYHVDTGKCMDLNNKRAVMAECSKEKTQTWYWKRRKNTTPTVKA